ncbi:hypothetical protein HAX54_027506 [Datura stramonium]|uniref:Uncharacterized protein n=1 Tax=Datura stramonium TaxID=4076 RepID=A0ABS8V5C1_DATST|nr:hypothetical protein [Datura stramonium]
MNHLKMAIVKIDVHQPDVLLVEISVLLPGANGDDLKKIKLVLRYSIFASYHLALETSFLADEGPSELPLNSPIIVALPDKSSTIGRNFDKPLGRFLKDNLFDQSYKCSSCEMPSEAHVQCYTHRQGTLTISVKNLLESLLPGEREGKIWMWRRLLRCPRVKEFPPATQRVMCMMLLGVYAFRSYQNLVFQTMQLLAEWLAMGIRYIETVFGFMGMLLFCSLPAVL